MSSGILIWQALIVVRHFALVSWNKCRGLAPIVRMDCQKACLVLWQIYSPIFEIAPRAFVFRAVVQASPLFARDDVASITTKHTGKLRNLNIRLMVYPLD